MHHDSNFGMLCMIGLITEAQRQSALEHPQRSSIADTDLVGHLVWMVEQRIVQHAELIARAVVYMGDDSSHPHQAQCLAILNEVLAQLETLSISMNGQLFDRLQEQGVITETERFCAGELPQPIAFDTQGEALAYLVANDVLLESRLTTLKEQQQAGEAGSAERMRILEEAGAIIRQEQLSREAKLRRAMWPPLRRSVGALLLGCSLMAAYQFYHFANGVPDCDAPMTKKAIWSMVAGIPRGLDSGGAAPASILSEIKEIGYASAHRQRGCTATLSYKGETLPYAYVIGPAAGTDDEIVVGSANRAIVEARFASIGDDGDFSNKADPIGRSQLASALRAAAEEARPTLRPVMPSVEQSVNALFRQINPERLREIADVEPVGQCREIQSNRQYACRVLVERNDRLKSMLGMPADVLDAEFTFVRDADTGPWRMSEDFEATLARAILDARMASLNRKPGS